MGRFGGTRGFNSAPGIYSAVCASPRGRYFGAVALLIPLVIYTYYVSDRVLVPGLRDSVFLGRTHCQRQHGLRPTLQ